MPSMEAEAPYPAHLRERDEPAGIPPSNTAMLNGFNFLFDAKCKLGSWESYLDMRASGGTECRLSSR